MFYGSSVLGTDCCTDSREILSLLHLTLTSVPVHSHRLCGEGHSVCCARVSRVAQAGSCLEYCRLAYGSHTWTCTLEPGAPTSCDRAGDLVILDYQPPAEWQSPINQCSALSFHQARER